MNRIAIFDDGMKSSTWGTELVHNQPSTNYYKNYYYGSDIEKEITVIDSTDFGAKEYRVEFLPEFYMDVQIQTKKKRAKIYDVNEVNGFLVLSQKALSVLTSVDSMSHQVLPVSIKNWAMEEAKEKYFIINTLRYIEVEKDFSPFDFPSPMNDDFKAYIHGLINSDRIRDYLANKCIWRMRHIHTIFFLTESLVQLLLAAGCTGLDEKTLKKDSRHGAPIRYV